MAVSGVEVSGPTEEQLNEVLTEDALEFVAELHRRFDERRRGLLEKRAERQRALDEGGTL
ncbi:MAG: malate synthase, partial [Thermoleophilaceae bacterium]|nr:malate synthase [Thermoleophilaceae bacterium]